MQANQRPATGPYPAALAVVCAACLSVAQAADWRQFGADAAHSGWNRSETTLGAGNVAQLISRYANPVVLPAKVDGAPVYASGVATAGGARNLLFLLGSDSFSDFSSTTSTFMAVDAANGAVVWSKSVSGSGHNSRQHASSSPAIDAAKQFVYAFGIDGYVHKYRIGDGTEVQAPGPAGWPAQVTLKPDVEKVASSLTIVESGGAEYLVAVTDGYIGDGGDYQGHLVSIDLGSGARKVFNFMCSATTTLLANGGCPNGRMSGAWGRGGATFDAGTGRLFVATGNGQFDANSPGGRHWGDSVLALAPDGSGGGGVPLGSYTPTNHQALADADADLGSTSPAMLPVPSASIVRHLGLQVGKDAQLRLIDLADLSGSGVLFRDGFDGTPVPARVGGEVQLLGVPQGGSGMREQPAVWVDPAGSTWVFVANWAGLSGLQLGLDANHRPQLAPRWSLGHAATSPAVANGVLYHAGVCASGNGECLVARNPATGDVLWNSPQIGGAHWQSPIVVDGAVYFADNDARLWKFALP